MRQPRLTADIGRATMNRADYMCEDECCHAVEACCKVTHCDDGLMMLMDHGRRRKLYHVRRH